MLSKWYLEKAKIQFNESLNRCWQKFNKFNFSKPKIYIRQMQRRWGSLSDKGTMTININLIRAPKDCIDYVVTHELCHLKYHNHSQAFYKLVASVIHDWKKIKQKLELSLGYLFLGWVLS